MKIFLKIKDIYGSMINIKDKRGKIGVALWMAFFVVLTIILIVILKRAGYFSNQAFLAAKEALFPFG
jgi:hypothetical protein|tara:strand:+ start:4700 stop:4900 length:201 start_codon:yes stop_codon:yes gene_type:complete